MDSKVKSLTAQYRYDKWVAIISEHNASGLSIRDWCRQNNVKETSYYYWLKKMRHSIVESIDQDDRNGEVSFVPMLSQPKTNELSHVKANSTAQPEVIIGFAHFRGYQNGAKCSVKKRPFAWFFSF